MLEDNETRNPFDINAIESAPKHNNDSPEGFVDSCPPELSEDVSLNPDIQISFTQNHPMGRILIGLLKDSFQLAKKTNVKEMNSDLNELCTNFYNSMRWSNMSTKRQISQRAKELEQNLIDRELNSHLLNENTDPPKHFSSVPTLITPQLRNEALKSFPTRHPKFSGVSIREGGVDVIEFLTAMNTAQEYCNLSEKEFKQFLLLCTTGRAHSLLSEWIKLEETVPTLYHSMIMHFDKRMTPQSAKELLFTYKAPKTLTLREVETNIMLWVSRAATIFPAGPSRIAYYNLETIEALIRCLPPISSARVQSVYNSLSARLGRAALATELSRALNIDRHAIDLDIKHNGVDKNYNTGTKPHVHRRKPPSKGLYTYKIDVPQVPVQDVAYIPILPNTGHTYNVSTTVPASSIQSNQNRQFRFNKSQKYVQKQDNHANKIANVHQAQVHSHAKVHKGQHNKSKTLQYASNNSRGKGRNRFGRPSNKTYCSLCGKVDHIASQGCPFMMTDSGVRIGVMPSHSTCTLCPPHVSPRLNHPPSVCPYRKGGPFSSA